MQSTKYHILNTKKVKKSILFIIVFAVIGIGFFLLPKSTAEAWYSDNWGYRVKILLSGSADSDKKVKVDIDTATLITAGKLQDDCGDSRFTDANGQLLRYYIDTAVGDCDTSSTDYYILVPTYHAGDTILYHYYGNPSAANGTEGTQFSESTYSQTGTSSATEERGKGPVAYYKFNEGTGTNAQDSTTNNLDATLGTGSSAPSWTSKDLCVTGSCLQFDGSEDYASKTDDASLDFNDQDFTLQGWFKRSSSDTDDTILAKRNSYDTASDVGYTLYISSGDDLILDISDGTDEYTLTSSTSFTNTGAWYHFAIVWDDNSAANSEIYINGIADNATDSGTIGNIGDLSNALDFTIGTESDQGNPFKGFLDDIKVYPYARTAVEIKQDYASVGSAQGSSVSLGEGIRYNLSDGLVAYYPMDEASADTCTGGTNDTCDASGNSLDGAWNGNATSAAGKYGNGVSFDGTGDFIDIGTGPTDVKSISFWVYPDTTTEHIIDLNGTVYISAASGTISATGFTDEKIYVNGIESATLSASTWQLITISSNTSISATDFDIGRLESTDDFQGELDEVRIYNRSLSKKEVLALYNWAPGPVAHWDFNENTGVAGSSETISHEETQGHYESGFVTSITTDSLSAGTDDLYIAGILYEDDSGSASVSVTGLGLTWTKRLDQCDPYNYEDMEIWTAYGSGTSGGVTATISTGSMDGPVMVASRYDGVSSEDKATGYVSDNSSGGGGCSDAHSTTATIDITTGEDNSTIWNLVSTGAREVTVADTDYTERIEEPPGNENQSMWVYDRTLGTAGTDTISHTVTNKTRWTIAALEIEPSSTPSDTIDDISSNGLTGTLTGSITEDSWEPGKFGSALKFNGSDDSITVSDDATVDFTTTESFTVTGWFKHTTQSSGQDVILAKYETTGADGGYKVLMESDGDITCAVDTDNSTFPLDSATSTAATYDDDEWHHFACVKDGSTSLTLYIDGLNIVSDSSLTGSGSYANDDDLYIGIDGDGSSNAWLGSLDDIKFYRYALTGKQIIQDLNAGHPSVGTPIGATVGHWSFDEGYGDTANDKSPQSNDGDLAGSATSCPTTGACPSWKLDGKYGKALNFDGTDDYVQTTTTGLSATEGTISSWFKQDDSGAGNEMIVAHRGSTGGDHRIYIFIDSSDNLKFSLGATESVDSTVDITAGSWYHSVLTWDSGTYYFYVNGVEYTTGAYTTLSTIASCLTIGSFNDSCNGTLNSHFDGTIDEVKIYPFALTDDQVKVEYNQGKAQVLGTISTTSDGTTPDWSSSREHCVPGDTSTCNAPIAEWLFNEHVSGDSQTLYDTSENDNKATSNDGANNTGMYCKYPGIKGSACDYDGTDDYAEVPDDATLDFNDVDFSITGWFKRSSFTTDDVILAKRNGISVTDQGYILYIDDASDTLIFEVCDLVAACDEYQLESTTTFTSEEWVYYAVVWDDDSAANTEIYINGIDDNATDTGTIGNIGDLSNSVVLRFASESDGANYFDGAIDNVKIFDYALTPAQVAWDYNKGAPIAHYKFDECSGTTAYNSAPTYNDAAPGNNGTITEGGSGDNNGGVGTCSSGNGDEMWDNGTTGKLNSSLDFDGTDDYVEITDSTDFDSDYMTVSSWVYLDSLASANFREIFTKVNISGDRYVLSVYDPTDDKITAYVDGNSNCKVSSINPIVAATWTHIAVLLDGTNHKLYIDGQFDNEVSCTEEWDSIGGNLYIGAYSTSNDFWNGKIDDVRIYNYALTSLQIKQIYNDGAVNFK